MPWSESQNHKVVSGLYKVVSMYEKNAVLEPLQSPPDDKSSLSATNCNGHDKYTPDGATSNGQANWNAKDSNDSKSNDGTESEPETKENIFRWIIAILAATIYMFNGGVFYSNGLLLPEFIKMLGCGQVIGTWMASVQMAMCQICAMLGGALIELYGCKAVNLAGTILISTGLVLSSFATSVPIFFLTYSIIPGIGLGLQFMPCIVVVQHHFSAKHRSAATGIASAGSPVGIFIFAVVTRWLLDTYACRGTLLLLGALNAHAIPLALIAWPIQANPSSAVENTHNKSCVINIKEKGLQTLQEISRALRQVGKGVRELRQHTVALMFISCTAFSLGAQTPFIFLPINTVLIGHGAWKAAYLVSVMGIGDTTGRLLFGCLGSVLPVSRTLLVVYGSLAAGVACCVSGVLNDYAALVCTCLIYGIGIGSNIVLNAPVLVDLLGLERIAHLFGLCNLGYGIGLLCSSPTQAFLYKLTDNIQLPFYIGGGCQIFAAACVLFVYFLNKRNSAKNSTLQKEDLKDTHKDDLDLDPKVMGSLHNMPVINVFGSTLSIRSNTSAKIKTRSGPLRL